MAKSITNSADVLDSRDIIARIDELNTEFDDWRTEHEGGDLDAWEADGGDGDELASLRALQEEAEGYSPNWNHGAQLIRDSYFEDYTREFASDIWAVNPRMVWPLTCIDWERAAEELQQNYTQVDFDGVSYWVR